MTDQLMDDDMRSRMFTALIELRDSISADQTCGLGSHLRRARGVFDAQIDAEQPLVTVDFDAEQIGLAELVRAIEDCGAAVCGVAQRRSRPALATARS